jgi:hypothetical protein
VAGGVPTRSRGSKRRAPNARGRHPRAPALPSHQRANLRSGLLSRDSRASIWLSQARPVPLQRLTRLWPRGHLHRDGSFVGNDLHQHGLDWQRPAPRRPSWATTCTETGTAAAPSPGRQPQPPTRAQHQQHHPNPIFSRRPPATCAPTPALPRDHPPPARQPQPLPVTPTRHPPEIVGHPRRYPPPMTRNHRISIKRCRQNGMKRANGNGAATSSRV